MYLDKIIKNNITKTSILIIPLFCIYHHVMLLISLIRLRYKQWISVFSDAKFLELLILVLLTIWFKVNVVWSWVLEDSLERINIVELSSEQTTFEALTSSCGSLKYII